MDKDDSQSIGEARKMGGHSTKQQTSDHVRHKKPRKTSATR
ncbi:hypothetical protein [Variovorax sp. J31P207]|nr:hypothetical protein [Variovorax sp. J31P207]MDM0066770.1 hypothetical protein [Variovorax sp. J31P207]